MLTTTNKSIKQIAQDIGFDTVHYFTTVFSEEMNISPGRFAEKFAKF
jgi:AraC-like DNA-binding protein